MDTSATSGVDPADWTALIEQGFFARLREVLAPEDVEQQVRRRLAELDEQLRHLVHNPLDAANVRFTSLAVAAYDVLEPTHGPAPTSGPRSPSSGRSTTSTPTSST